MKIYSYNQNTIVIYYYNNDLEPLTIFLNSFEKNSDFIIYFFGNPEIKTVCDTHLKYIYMDNITDIKTYEEISLQLLKLENKLNSLFLLQDYKLINPEPYILYEICLFLEETYRKKLNINKIKTKIIKYLESKNKIKSLENVKKIQIYG